MLLRCEYDTFTNYELVMFMILCELPFCLSKSINKCQENSNDNFAFLEFNELIFPRRFRRSQPEHVESLTHQTSAEYTAEPNAYIGNKFGPNSAHIPDAITGINRRHPDPSNVIFFWLHSHANASSNAVQYSVSDRYSIAVKRKPTNSAKAIPPTFNWKYHCDHAELAGWTSDRVPVTCDAKQPLSDS